MRGRNPLRRIVGSKGDRRWRRLVVAPLLLPLVIFLALIGLAQAAPDDNGLFELDANVADQAAVGDDWSNIFDGTDSAFVDTGIVADPAPQTIFTGGGSKDDLDIPQWKHKNGSYRSVRDGPSHNCTALKPRLMSSSTSVSCAAK